MTCSGFVQCSYLSLVFFNVAAPPEIYTFSLHDALPIFRAGAGAAARSASSSTRGRYSLKVVPCPTSLYTQMNPPLCLMMRSEEHTSELQSHHDLVCRLLLEKKN